MNILSGFAHISLWQILLVAGVALFASIVGGVSGYGTGALMPLVLVPLVGPEPVVPIIAISSMVSNTSRLTAFLNTRTGGAPRSCSPAQCRPACSAPGAIRAYRVRAQRW
jgi:hypothetical protein